MDVASMLDSTPAPHTISLSTSTTLYGRTPFKQARDGSRLCTRLLSSPFSLCARLVLMGAIALCGAFRDLDGGRRRNVHRVFQPLWVLFLPGCHALSDGTSWSASALGLCPAYQALPGLWAVLVLVTVAIHPAPLFSDTLSLTCSPPDRGAWSYFWAAGESAVSDLYRAASKLSRGRRITVSVLYMRFSGSLDLVCLSERFVVFCFVSN